PRADAGYIGAARAANSPPPGPNPPQFQSLTVELSSPPTYWMSLLTWSSSGSRQLNRELPGGPRRPLRRELSGMGSRVERVQLVLVLSGHDPTLELHARGEVSLLHGEVTRQDQELLDRLPAVEPGVDLVDVALDQLPRRR